MTYSTVHDIRNVYICPHRVPQARVFSLVDQFLRKTTAGNLLLSWAPPEQGPQQEDTRKGSLVVQGQHCVSGA